MEIFLKTAAIAMVGAMIYSFGQAAVGATLRDQVRFVQLGLGPQLADLFDGLSGISTVTDDFEALVLGEQASEGGAEHALVIDQEH